ncbi:hypothetical protein LSAT2_008326 [Lamellibrachia satsuma]|nr:hypothetical protein LSAT2_008326 [Lamellibrachia satsuma]
MLHSTSGSVVCRRILSVPMPPPLPTAVTSPVDVSCVTTGPSCIKSCRGQPNGDYQSCRGCHVYVTCSNWRMFPDRPCPAKLVWDDSRKRCEWSSKTCVNCPPADRSSNFYIDLREDILGVGDEENYKWAVRPESTPSNDDKCVRQGTLMVRPPKCTTEIRAFLEFKDPQGYSFHATHHVFADGWAGFDGSGHYGIPGMEIHTFNRSVYGFVMTATTSDNVYVGESTVSDTVYLEARQRGFVNNFAGVYLGSSRPLRPTSDVFFVGINRVVSPLFGDAIRDGSGLCSLWINCIC